MALCFVPDEEEGRKRGLPNSRRPWTGCAAVEVSERPPRPLTCVMSSVLLRRRPGSPPWSRRCPVRVQWYARAEAALYEAKRRGRNCTSIARMLSSSFKRAGRCKFQSLPYISF